MENGAGRPGARAAAQACGSWIKVSLVADRQEVDALRAVLDEGEAEVIVLGQELRAGLLLLDNREPRLFARSLSLVVMGTVGVLKLGWLKGLLNDPVTEILRMRQRGFWLDDRLIEALRVEVASGTGPRSQD